MVSLCHIAVCYADELTVCDFSQYGKQNAGNDAGHPKMQVHSLMIAVEVFPSWYSG